MTSTADLLAKHLKQVFFGGNWTSSNLRDQLKDVDYEMANRQHGELNTIVKLFYHIGYYVSAILNVLEGKPLNAKDAYSFDHPPVNNENDWQEMQERTWKNVNRLADVIEELPDARLQETFADEKYGSYHRNLLGLVEHTHYHLGQIAVIKKLYIND